MKTYVFVMFLVLAAAAAVYIASSLRSIRMEQIEQRDIPQGAYETIKWISDADAIAYIMDDPAEQTAVAVSKGMGRRESEGFRPSQDVCSIMPGKIQVYRIIDKKSGQAVAYVLASERLEIQTGFNILKQRVVLYIKDPEDSHHRRAREGP